MQKEYIVALDNGHGSRQYMKGSKLSPDGRIYEGEYVREIVDRIIQKLKNLGIMTFKVVPESSDISLKTRCDRVNKLYKEHNGKVIFISVHVNAAGCGEWKNARGWSAWTSKGQTKGDKLADCLYEAAHEIFDPVKIKVREDRQDGDPDYEENFYVLKHTICPAVLTENFFMDNKEDVEFLLSEKGKEMIVDVHVNGILKWLQK